MIKTEVKQLSDNEHRIDVFLPKGEYTRRYEENLSALLRKGVQLPGFRPGKVPRNVVAKKFAANLRQDTVSALVQTHYGPALEESGLQPAVQPKIELPEAEIDDVFSFQLLVTTWPEVELASLADLTVEKWDVTVNDADVDGVITRLMASQFRYEPVEKPIEQGDKVCMDYTGYIANEAFDGGTAENAELVIGSESYIPGFETQLLGAEAGQQRDVMVSFPEDYQVESLAGQSARFDVHVKTVMKGSPCDSVNDLAILLGFSDEAALHADAKARLESEAKKATEEKTRDSVDAALLKANPVTVPDPILQEHVYHSVKKYEKRRADEGEAPLSDEEQNRLVQQASLVEHLKLRTSIIFQAIQKQGKLSVTEDDVSAKVDALVLQYPEHQREAYLKWLQTNKGKREEVESGLLESHCVEYVLAQSHVTHVVKTITQLQEELDAETAPSSEAQHLPNEEV